MAAHRPRSRHEAKRNRFKRLAVLGTRYLMEGPVYLQPPEGGGIEHRIPSPPQRDHINQIISTNW